jgi:hypothetical protein
MARLYHIDISMKILLSLMLFTFTELQAGDPYVLFEENGKVGIKNPQGTVIIPATYEALGWSEGPLLPVANTIGYKLKGQWGIIDLNNKRITDALYTSLSRGNESLIVATRRSPLTLRMTTGCLYPSGKEAIPFQYTAIKISDLRAIVCILDDHKFKYGLIDLTNKLLIPAQYRTITPLGSLRYAVENFDGKTALFNDAGRPVTSFGIDSMSSFQNNLANIYQGGLQGIINRDGTIIHEARYKSITLSNGTLVARLPDTWLAMSDRYQISDTVQADSLIQLTPHRFKKVNGAITSLVNEKFEPVGPTYQQVGNYQDGYALAKRGKLGIVDINGVALLPFQFSNISITNTHFFTNTYTAGRNNWSVYDRSGKCISRTTYDAVLAPSAGLIPVKKRGFWGALDANGVEVLGCVYDTLLDIRNEQVLVKFKGQYGIVNTQEQWLVTPKPTPLMLVNESRFIEKSEDLLFLKSFTGYTYYFTSNPVDIKTDGFVEHTSSGATWTLNFDGQIIKREEMPEEKSDVVLPSSEGLRVIKRDGKFGFIDDRGRLRIANRYEDASSFSEGLAAIKIRGKWGFINREERIVIQPAYEAVSSFSKGVAHVRQKGKFGLLQANGTLVLPTRYDSVGILKYGWLLLKQGEHFGLADAEGNIVLQTKFEYIDVVTENQFVVKQFEKYGMINAQGLSMIPLHFDALYFDETGKRYIGLIRPAPITLK